MHHAKIAVHNMRCTIALTANVRRVYKRNAMHLSDYMIEKNLSDDVVAAAICRSRVSVSRYRRRLVRPDWETIEAIRSFSGDQVTHEDWRDQLVGEAAE